MLFNTGLALQSDLNQLVAVCPVDAVCRAFRLAEAVRAVTPTLRVRVRLSSLGSGEDGRWKGARAVLRLPETKIHQRLRNCQSLRNLDETPRKYPFE
eukprot:3324643-Pleurochrysis_carterae.AAC.4